MPIKLDQIPTELLKIIGPTKWEEISIGYSDSSVYKLSHMNQPSFYLKIAASSAQSNLLAERERLDWLQNRLPVPKILYHEQNQEQQFLLLSEIPGLMSCDELFAGKVEQVVRLLAAGLKDLHSLDISECPFDRSLNVVMQEARYNLDNGLVDESDFDEERQGKTAHQLYTKLKATRPKSEDLVFTHGDYCLPNILISGDMSTISGFIDLGRAGIADRYQDLALAARSLIYNWGEEWLPLLFREYGLENPDQNKVNLYQLLDEFF